MARLHAPTDTLLCSRRHQCRDCPKYQIRRLYASSDRGRLACTRNWRGTMGCATLTSTSAKRLSDSSDRHDSSGGSCISSLCACSGMARDPAWTCHGVLTHFRIHSVLAHKDASDNPILVLLALHITSCDLVGIGRSRGWPDSIHKGRSLAACLYVDVGDCAHAISIVSTRVA